MIENHLIIFIKNPIAGKTKTRLAKTMGNEKALEIYKELTDYTRHVCLRVPFKRTVFYSDFIEPNDQWNPNLFSKLQQEGNDLGERMNNAFSVVLNESPKVIIIGSDCPGIDPFILKTAFEKLDNYDIVLGPSTDGGYYMLGMKESHSKLFTDIDWGSSFVRQQTINKIEAIDLSYFELKPLSDIDKESDWNRHRHLVKNIKKDPDADFIFHVSDYDHWMAQAESDFYRVESLETEDFIHCCYDHQFDHVLSNYFKKGQKLMILRLDPLLLKSHLKIEKAGDKGFFPHIYAPIDKSWIVSMAEQINNRG